MASSSKPDLSRSGTMQVTAKEGKGFLDRNLTEWKKPHLIEDYEEPPKSKKPKMSKHSTMKHTAKEADDLLGDERPDADAFTRGQQKKIEDIESEKPPTKKSKMARDNTMAATAKEAKGLLGSDKLADTRQETGRRKSKGSLKRKTTVDKVLDEAKLVYKDLDTSGGRSLRKRAAPAPKKAAPPKTKKKTPMKKAGTMVKTAKEGKAYLKRTEAS